MLRRCALVALLVLAACGSSDRPRGSDAVYARIDATTDCRELQAEFDRAMGNAETATPNSERNLTSLDYAKAAQERMDELGC